MEAPQQYPETSYSLGLNNCGVGDVNGDGFSDYLVYRPISGIHDSTDTLDAFTTLLFLGNSVLSQEPALVYSRNLSGADSACGMGYVMAGLGDVNGDGYDDYAISAPHAITDTVPSQGIVRGGKVYVHFGGPMPDTIPDLIIKGDWRRRIAWWSLCGADVNGNGYNDLIIGSSEWGMWPGDGGRVDIYYGGVSMDTIPDKTILGGIHIGGMESEQFGWCIDNCGDVNNDGYEDIIVGAPSNHQRNECAGKAYLFFGGKNMDLEPDWWFYGENLHQFLGEMVSDAGDFNGDGYDDFMIGDRFYPHFYNSYGRVLLFFGGPVLDTIPSWVINGHFWLGPNCTNDLGSNVDALGDVNNDGYDDLLIGNSKYRHYGECPGRILLYYGGEEPDTLPDIEYIGEIGYERATGLNLCNAGDVNGDGINDILFGNNYPPIVPFPDFYGWVRIMKYVETAVPDTVLVKGGDCYVICRWNDHHINNTILYQLFRCINPDTSGWQLAGECQPKIAFDHQIIDRNVGFDESRYYWLKILAQSGLTDLFGPYPAGASAMDIEFDVAWQPGDVIELKWQPEGGDVTGYNVYRDQAGMRTRVNPTLLSTGQRSYLDTGVKSGEEYEYWLGVIQSSDEERLIGPVRPAGVICANPNPFRVQTRIKVQQSRAGTYKLEIYNVLGQKVRSLWSGYQPAGVQEIVWDGCDDQNRCLSAGIYYCMYQMGSNKNTTKVILLK